MNRRRWIGVASIALAPVLTALKCGDDSPPLLMPARGFDVGMVNDASEAVHILAPGETRSDGNRLAPMQSRQLRLLYDDGPEFRFRAERNGVLLIDMTCTVPPRTPSDYAPLVIFDEDPFGGEPLPGLACVDW